ncbi:MAG: uncharacterized protein KVP18_001982 [Porospora cf. gigantea A]|uniref:uncharacterized protein n=1 Tax=Porospora cf. gigantea A TaxID=2853593 RepID=UPI00355A5E0C|nr:MAG: hypothetical protein KVP18_001982 [Porospora cf. gigantea A]
MTAEKSTKLLLCCWSSQVSLNSASHSGLIAATVAFVNPMKHDFFPVTTGNFDATIGRFRHSYVSVVLMYDEEDEDYLNGTYQQAASAMKGMAKFGAVDCRADRAFCSGKKTEGPTLLVYPPNPAPERVLKSNGRDAIEKAVMRSIPKTNVGVLAPTTFDKFIKEGVGVPKVFILSEADKPAGLFHAVANALADRMNFVFVPIKQDGMSVIADRLQVTKFPKLVLVKSNDPRRLGPDYYSSKFTFGEVFEWLNIRAETFVKGGGFSGDAKEATPKPWLMEAVPELSKLSVQDVCLKKGLCVIYLSKGPIPKPTLETLTHFSDEHQDGKFSFMWLDLSLHEAWQGFFPGVEAGSVVVFNHKKRFRFIGPLEATDASIRQHLDRILNGDAKYTRMAKRTAVPAFTKKPDNSRSDL